MGLINCTGGNEPETISTVSVEMPEKTKREQWDERQAEQKTNRKLGKVFVQVIVPNWLLFAEKKNEIGKLKFFFQKRIQKNAQDGEEKLENSFQNLQAKLTGLRVYGLPTFQKVLPKLVVKKESLKSFLFFLKGSKSFSAFLFLDFSFTKLWNLSCNGTLHIFF